MSVSIQARDPAESQVAVVFDLRPDACPICHHAIEAKLSPLVGLTGNHDASGTDLEIVFRCPRRSCSRYFVGRYAASFQGGRLVNAEFRLKSLVPWVVQKPTLPAEVIEVSPAFEKIFTQASAAEAYGLEDIAGVGYRKALEFLVKDFCILEKPGEEEAIKNELLGQTIANRIADANVKDCARRAAWLGNDETYYLRKWEDKDIKDLKRLIGLTMNWIQNSVLTKRYLKEMSEPRA